MLKKLRGKEKSHGLERYRRNAKYDYGSILLNDTLSSILNFLGGSS